MATLAAVRVIAGEFRGRKLLGPRGKATRPITDRAKQSMFDVLTPWIAGAAVYDCFAGTGSLGLEALSRGSTFATFFEADGDALRLLAQNVQMLGVADRSRIVAGDLFAWIETAPPPPQPVDLIFLDPPYRYVAQKAGELNRLVGRLAREHLAPGGILVFRHDRRDKLELAPLARYDQRDYGKMRVEFFVSPRG